MPKISHIIGRADCVSHAITCVAYLNHRYRMDAYYAEALGEAGTAYYIKTDDEAHVSNAIEASRAFMGALTGKW